MRVHRAVVIIVLIIFEHNSHASAATAFASCDQIIVLHPFQFRTVHSANFPLPYSHGSSCRYNITTLSGYRVDAVCFINIRKPSATMCTTDFFYISQEGGGIDGLPNGSEYFCGFGMIARQSFYNRMTIAHKSLNGSARDIVLTGTYSCKLTAVPQQCDCGWSMKSRIVNGVETAINEFPPMTGLVFKETGQIFCGGAIINYRYILTAAHCLTLYKDPATIQVLVGDHDVSTGVETQSSAVYDVEAIIPHENYNSATKENDIALLRLKTDIVYSRAVGPVCLPFNLRARSFSNEMVEAAGWGTTEFGGPVAKKLNKVTLDVMANDVCAILVADLTNTQLCTFTPDKDTCQYDSGANLFYMGNGNDGAAAAAIPSSRLYTVGIVSFGTGCAGPEPAVNTRVTSYLDWIERNSPDARYCRR